MKYLCYDINGSDVSCWMHIKDETTINTVAGRKSAYAVDHRVFMRGGVLIKETVDTIIYDSGVKGLEIKVVETAGDGEIPDEMLIALLDDEKNSLTLGAMDLADDELRT